MKHLVVNFHRIYLIPGSSQLRFWTTSALPVQNVPVQNRPIAWPPVLLLAAFLNDSSKVLHTQH